MGTRADVLCDLLEHPGSWSAASQLAEGGHSKRNVTRVLAELDEAGIVVHQATGNVLRFRLVQPGALIGLLGGCPDRRPDRVRIFEFVSTMLGLAAMETLPAAVLRVEANTLREVLRPLSDRLSLPGLPKTRGEPKAWEALVDWATVEMAALARGDSAALRAGGR